MGQLLKPVGMFITPTSQEDLVERVQDLRGEGSATLAMMFTWNYCASLVNEEAEDDTDKG